MTGVAAAAIIPTGVGGAAGRSSGGPDLFRNGTMEQGLKRLPEVLQIGTGTASAVAFGKASQELPRPS
eukprot:5389821-Prorocentrum_lima.AAC.1